MKHRIVITRHRPWLRWGITAAVVVLLASGARALYSYTRATTVSDFEAAQTELQRVQQEGRDLRTQLREALTEKKRLSEEVVYLEQAQGIDQQACGAVKRSLKGLQAEVSELREQVAFYRGIVSPGESKAGVRVYDFKVRRASAAKTYRYELVLIQSVRNDRRVAGTVQVALQGVRAGAAQKLSLSDLALDKGQGLMFSFKYFQEFSGEFRLPADFQPARVTVAVVPEGSHQPSVEDAYDWAKVQAAGGATDVQDQGGRDGENHD